MPKATVESPRQRERRASDALVEAMAIMDELLNYVKHTKGCPHPTQKCNCGLPAVLVKARRFGVFLALSLIGPCAYPRHVQAQPTEITIKFSQPSNSAPAITQTVVAPPLPTPKINFSRPDQGEWRMHISQSHDLQVIDCETITEAELVDRFRTNRSALTLLVATPNTNGNRIIPMPHRK